MKLTFVSSNPNTPRGESFGGIATVTRVSFPSLAPPVTLTRAILNISRNSTSLSSMIVISISPVACRNVKRKKKNKTTKLHL